MRFTYAEAMTDPSYYIPLAQAAEAAGYHAMTIADSVAYPYESDSTYPYTPDGNREFLDGKEFIETFVLTAALGAVTSRLHFNFFVLKLPIRPPALVAKQAGSLAALIGDRVGLGVGTSPWPEDYELMGVPFARRGKRMDECIEIIRGLTTGDYFEFHGEFYDIPKTKMSPAPGAPIPILIGGHADAALRRAARNDGWMHGGGDPEELDRLIAKVKRYRQEEGRDGDFQIHVISVDGFTLDGIKRLEDKGVTDVIVGFRIPYILSLLLISPCRLSSFFLSLFSPFLYFFFFSSLSFSFFPFFSFFFLLFLFSFF
uniref:TIGR03619 family F420-dependent LLM class oxidoreductase n=1 Tax=Mycolicibacterium palauense TaxID=2034511 RepID=UPI00159B9439